MNFLWSSDHVAYRQRVRDFIATHLPSDWARASGCYDVGSPYVTDFARRFCPALAREGLLVPHWPRAHGGQDADAWHHWILNEEMLRAGEPRGYQYMSVNWAGPALIRFGSDDQKRAFLPRIAAGEMFFCQGFSEPEAGSDLAALRTRAVRDDNGYRISGQKIWTSAASFADVCILLARTGGEGRDGISVFLVPMESPGITVRVIPGFQGVRAFHEIFFDDVPVPETALLGEENKGWSVVGAILHNERIGLPRYILSLLGLDAAIVWLQVRDRLDAIAQDRAESARAACEAARLQCYKVIAGRVAGEPPTAETSLARYSLVMADRMVAEFLGDYLMEAIVGADEPLIAAAYRRTAATGIASGTAEVQLNLIARQYLRLPRAA